ncbi:hypothetical protein B5P43_31380 [Bacillus sp. SRB_336]|nr:hypothetical protein B5P43_31380 [Bacillus sp. SRB_336]
MRRGRCHGLRPDPGQERPADRARRSPHTGLKRPRRCLPRRWLLLPDRRRSPPPRRSRHGRSLRPQGWLRCKPDKVDQVDVRAAPGVTAAALRDRISRSLPAGTQALTADEISGESSKSIRDGLQIFTNVLLAFAAVSLLVGSFVIWNTFNILVAQRRREVALLRAVGGTRRQILTGIITEAVIVRLAASGIGLVAGIGVATGTGSLLGAIGIEVPTTAAVVELRTVIAALLVGVVVTVAAAAIPALAATRVAPIEALRQATPAAGRIGRTRSVTGSVLLTAGAAALAVATAASNQPLVAGIGTLLAFAGLVVAGPHLARAIARLASRGRPGGAWSLASRNVARTPQRSSATAMALAIGLAVVCAGSVTAASTKASVMDLLSGGNRADLILKPAAVTGGLSPAVADLLRHQAGVDTVLEMRFSGANVDRVPISIAGVKPDGLDKVLDIGVTSGSSKDFQSATVLPSTKQATALNAAVGDRITVTFPRRAPSPSPSRQPMNATP